MAGKPTARSDENDRSLGSKGIFPWLRERAFLFVGWFPQNNLRILGTVLLVVLVPLILGWFLAVRSISLPAVGIIRLRGDIWAGSARLLMLQIDEARADPRIRAIVLELDSPGGEVTATQALYAELLSFRREMPVVTYLGRLAASGGYYLALATDPLYAQPSSTVGNVGAWGFFPPELGVSEIILSSGPFKLTASNVPEFLRRIEAIKQEFQAAVSKGRGDRLQISLLELSRGLAYSGREALELGLIDHLGSRTEAIAAAAELAGIAHYEVIDLDQRVREALRRQAAKEGDEGSLIETWIGAADPVTGRRSLPPGIYLLYDLRLWGAP